MCVVCVCARGVRRACCVCVCGCCCCWWWCGRRVAVVRVPVCVACGGARRTRRACRARVVRAACRAFRAGRGVLRVARHLPRAALPALRWFLSGESHVPARVRARRRRRRVLLLWLLVLLLALRRARPGPRRRWRAGEGARRSVDRRNVSQRLRQARRGSFYVSWNRSVTLALLDQGHVV